MENPVAAPARPRPLAFIIAFAAVYILWGSTYLAIKYALLTMPPLLMAGARFVVAGLVLGAVGWVAGPRQWPTWPQWRTAAIVGAALLVGGNGLVVLAERSLPSGLAALLVASEPLWVVVLGWWWLGQARPGARVVLGLLLGLGGVYLLVRGQLGAEGGASVLGVGLVLLAAFSWAAGSIYGLRAPRATAPLLASAMQMLCGGGLLLALGTVRGEWQGFALGQVSGASWLGWGYLVVFGSLAAFTAYGWLLRHAPPAQVATYAYVNPVVAVGLGWLVLGEQLTPAMLAGAVVVVVAVVLITGSETPAERPK